MYGEYMIIQSPESEMPEPYKTYVRQRNHCIASELEEIADGNNIQLCPRAITTDERIFNGDEDILYGVLVNNEADGYKSVLYSPVFRKDATNGTVARTIEEAFQYAAQQFEAGNRVRVKDPGQSDGKGQRTVETTKELEETFLSIPAYGDTTGVVLMPHVNVTQRISIGRIMLGAPGNFFYLGNEHTQAHNGETVYGGTTLGLFKGYCPAGRSIVEKYLGLSPRLVSMGMMAIEAYDQIALEANRVSVDVVEGFTDNGTRFQDVIDITPRIGGTTPAEVLAIKEICKGVGRIMIAKSQLIYDPEASPGRGVNFVNTDTLVINAEVLEVIT